MNAVAKKIRDEIAARGAISFARFMELALYCPVCGFYETETDTVGKHGHFYTSVSVGSLFGELLAFQFADWFENEIGLQDRVKRGGGRGLQIGEAGAHDGRLAGDILEWLRTRRPDLFEQVEYWIVEPSERRRSTQAGTLAEFSGRVRWWRGISDLRAIGVSGVIFANELLDAMPVQRLGWDAKSRRWFEWGVTFERERLVWQRLPNALEQGAIVNCAGPELLEVLPDGFVTEICPAAEAWWRNAAGALRHGKLMTFDYGLDAEELFAPHRTGGTLRAYQRHRPHDDVLANPGEQDITSHVNFAAIRAAGEAADLKTAGLMTQTQFLTSIAQRAWQPGSGFGPWTPQRTRQFQTLTHPEHLGRSFRTLIQSR